MIFLDSNVWFYAYSETGDERKHRIAVSLAMRPQICMSSQVVNELVFNLMRKAKGTEQYLSDLIRKLYREYLVLEILQDDVLTASDLRQEYKFSYWDSLIVATALRANADILYSEDMQDGLVVRNRITIRNPFKQ